MFPDKQWASGRIPYTLVADFSFFMGYVRKIFFCIFAPYYETMNEVGDMRGECVRRMYMLMCTQGFVTQRKMKENDRVFVSLISIV
jgi:hypothetical protein